MADATHVSRSFKQIIKRALNKNQMLILYEASNNSGSTLTSLLLAIEAKSAVPLSTLKLNARILKNLGLISFGNGESVRLTDSGRYIISLM